MRKRTASIFFVRCIAVALLLFFESVDYYVFGEKSVMQMGTLRTLWIIFPCVVVLFTIEADLIISKIYKKTQK